MSTSEAQHAANKANAAHSTGPKTPTGKSRSSKNRLTFGLFTISDFVREGDSNPIPKSVPISGGTLSRRNHRRGLHHRNHERHLASSPLPHGRRGHRADRHPRPHAGPRNRRPAEILGPRPRPVRQHHEPLHQRAAKTSDRARHPQPGLPRNRRSRRTRPDGPPSGRQNQTYGHRRGTRTRSGRRSPCLHAQTGFDALMALADKQLAQRYRDFGMAAFTGAPTQPPPAPVAASDLPSFSEA